MSADGVKNQNGIRVSIDASRVRQTPKTDFGSIMKTGLTRGANVVMSAGRLAAPFIPGGATVSAAIQGVGHLRAATGGLSASSSGLGAGGANATGLTMTGATGGGSVTTGLGVTGGIGGGSTIATGGIGVTGGTGAIGGSAGDPNAQLLSATQQMQEMNMSFNLQYLMLQQKMQGENRQFTLVSNIMKTKHDTAKNAISNVR